MTITQCPYFESCLRALGRSMDAGLTADGDSPAAGASSGTRAGTMGATRPDDTAPCVRSINGRNQGLTTPTKVEFDRGGRDLFNGKPKLSRPNRGWSW
jgi:hypothetical protein